MNRIERMVQFVIAVMHTKWLAGGSHRQHGVIRKVKRKEEKNETDIV